MMYRIFNAKPLLRKIQKLNMLSIGCSAYILCKQPEQAPLFALRIIVNVATLLALSNMASINQQRIGAALNLLMGVYFAQMVTPTNPAVLINILYATASMVQGNEILLEMTSSHTPGRRV